MNSEINLNDDEEERLCKKCGRPLEDNSHGNRQYHDECAYELKKERQKEKYLIGNDAKLTIQKNEEVAAMLYKMDPEKKGIPLLIACEYGLKINGPTTELKCQNRRINFFYKYGYFIDTINNQPLIFIYHESDL